MVSRVDVLKIQHHGSENNLDEQFARTVSADHYVFCGNGSHGNPETDVIDLCSSPVWRPSVRALAPQAHDRDFHSGSARHRGPHQRDLSAGKHSRRWKRTSPSFKPAQGAGCISTSIKARRSC
jgi:hypothetical protein